MCNKAFGILFLFLGLVIFNIHVKTPATTVSLVLMFTGLIFLVEK